ncbi:MAG TPA: hypothetical protein VMB05_17840 [Solirubrobacteraceae bacterium]|nr:hypothetical protein [Solirubrobacteraceae bacterium]
MRVVRRPRKYVAKHWMLVLRPLFAYNFARDAYVLRGVGRQVGPVLRVERRAHNERDRRPRADRPWRELPEGLEAGDSVDRRWARA